MTSVLAACALLVVATGALLFMLAERYDRYRRAPYPTHLPDHVPVAAIPPVPIGNQGDWFPGEGYPASARRHGEQGRVSVSLLIDAQGDPAACEVTRSSGYRSLDEATCRLAVRNGRFVAARDRSGTAIESRFAMRNVVWKLED